MKRTKSVFFGLFGAIGFAYLHLQVAVLLDNPAHKDSVDLKILSVLTIIVTGLLTLAVTNYVNNREPPDAT